MKDWMGRKRPRPGKPSWLTENFVIELRTRVDRTDREMAEELRIPVHIVYDARRGRTWKHIKFPAPWTDSKGPPCPPAVDLPVKGPAKE